MVPRKIYFKGNRSISNIIYARLEAAPTQERIQLEPINYTDGARFSDRRFPSIRRPLGTFRLYFLLVFSVFNAEKTAAGRRCAAFCRRGEESQENRMNVYGKTVNGRNKL